MTAFLVGTGLGLVFATLGAGGGILAVPVLLIAFEMPMPMATGASLVVVWVAAVFGAVLHARAGRVSGRAALLFGVPALLGAAGGARLHGLFSEQATAGLFAAMLGVSLILFARKDTLAPSAGAGVPVLLAAGLGTGVLTGLLGVGGGFLLVPALTVLAALPVHQAVGTSMAIISVSSLSGAVVHLLEGHVPVSLALPMGGGAVLGAVLGAPLAGRLPPRALKAAFLGLAVLAALGMAAKALALV